MSRPDVPLITFSGLDGCGKTTQMDRLEAALRARGQAPVRIWSRGGYTEGMLALKRGARRLLRRKLPQAGHSERRTHAFSKPRVTRLWLALSIADLIRLYGVVIPTLRRRGHPVLCDRYLWDTLVDFRMKFPDIDIRALPEWRILERVAATPRCQVYLSITPDLSEARSIQKADPWPEPLTDRRRRAALYQALVDAGTFTVFDATDSIASLEAAIAVCAATPRGTMSFEAGPSEAGPPQAASEER